MNARMELYKKKLDQALMSTSPYPINLKWMVDILKYKHISSLTTHLKRHFNEDEDYKRYPDAQNKRNWTYFISLKCFRKICHYSRHSERKQIAKQYLSKLDAILGIDTSPKPPSKPRGFPQDLSPHESDEEESGGMNSGNESMHASNDEGDTSSPLLSSSSSLSNPKKSSSSSSRHHHHNSPFQPHRRNATYTSAAHHSNPLTSWPYVRRPSYPLLPPSPANPNTLPFTPIFATTTTTTTALQPQHHHHHSPYEIQLPQLLQQPHHHHQQHQHHQQQSLSLPPPIPMYGVPVSAAGNDWGYMGMNAPKTSNNTCNFVAFPNSNNNSNNSGSGPSNSGTIGPNGHHMYSAASNNGQPPVYYYNAMNSAQFNEIYSNMINNLYSRAYTKLSPRSAPSINEISNNNNNNSNNNNNNNNEAYSQHNVITRSRSTSMPDLKAEPTSMELAYYHSNNEQHSNSNSPQNRSNSNSPVNSNSGERIVIPINPNNNNSNSNCHTIPIFRHLQNVHASESNNGDGSTSARGSSTSSGSNFVVNTLHHSNEIHNSNNSSNNNANNEEGLPWSDAEDNATTTTSASNSSRYASGEHITLARPNPTTPTATTTNHFQQMQQYLQHQQRGSLLQHLQQQHNQQHHHQQQHAHQQNPMLPHHILGGEFMSFEGAPVPGIGGSFDTNKYLNLQDELFPEGI